MSVQPSSLSVAEVLASIYSSSAPLRVDVRRETDLAAAGRIIAGSLRREPSSIETWGPALAGRFVMVYCAHGRAVSQSVCQRLLELGVKACYLEGGYAAWLEAGGPTAAWRAPLQTAPSRWITRERPKIDRVACPWLIRRFLDPQAEFFYVPTVAVREEARRLSAEPYDIPDVSFSHVGERCSFDAFIQHFDLNAPGLDALATIVRGADTGKPQLAEQASGLLAISLGLSANFTDDHALLEHGMVVYDALYTWCRSGTGEGHDWKPNTMEISA